MRMRQGDPEAATPDPSLTRKCTATACSLSRPAVIAATDAFTGEAYVAVDFGGLEVED